MADASSLSPATAARSTATASVTARAAPVRRSGHPRLGGEQVQRRGVSDLPPGIQEALRLDQGRPDRAGRLLRLERTGPGAEGRLRSRNDLSGRIHRLAEEFLEGGSHGI